MADFLEERLPIDARMGASYADEFAVEITTTRGGSESRRLIHPYPVRHFTINYTLDHDDLWTRVIGLYHRAYGMYAGFRVRCLDDYSTQGTCGTPTAFDQPMRRISAGLYQVQKQYGAGATPLAIGLPVRSIFKPVAGTLAVAKNGTQIVSGVTVNTTTGRVTNSPAPLITDLVTAGCEFDLPCRFNSRIDVAHISANLREGGRIDLIELVNP